MNKDWIFQTEEFTCDLRVAAVLVKGGKILVQRDADGSEYALPGGHVQVGEILESALSREFSEETGIPIRIRRMLWSEECFWEWNGRLTHNISFYYLVESDDDSVIPEGAFVPQKDNSRVVVGWLPLEELQGVTIYPDFLKTEIHRLDGGIQHFVTRA